MKAFKNDFLNNSLIMLNGTVVSQILNLIMTPFMSRLYTPADYGQYSVISSLTLILSVAASGKYDLAIMQEKEGKNKKDTYNLAMMLTIGFSGVIFIFGIFAKLLNIGTFVISDYFILSFFVFFTTANSIINIWLNSEGHFRQISKNRIIYSLSNLVGIIFFGIIHLGYKGIIYASLLAYLLQFFYVYYFLSRQIAYHNIYSFNRTGMIKQAKKYKKFPLYQMPALLLNSASSNLPVLLFTQLLGETISGYYSMTIKIINLPMSLIGNAIGEVYYNKATQYKEDEKKLEKLTWTIYTKLIILGSCGMGVIAALGDILFSFVLGKEWEMAGEYARILSPWYFLVFITSPFSYLFPILGKQKQNLFLNIVMLISRVMTIILGVIIFVDDHLKIIIIFSCSGTLLWLWVNCYILHLSGIKKYKSFLFSVGAFISGVVIFMCIRSILF